MSDERCTSAGCMVPVSDHPPDHIHLRAEYLVADLQKAQAELAEIRQRQGATWHHWTEVAAMPQAWTSERAGGTCHESVMRSFHVATEVRRLLELATPPAVVLQVMDLLEQRAPRDGGGS